MRLKTMLSVFFTAALLLPDAVLAESAPGLWPLLSQIRSKRWVDLTHSFDGSIPHWKGFDAMKSRVVYDHDKDGFKVEEFCHVGQ